MENPNFYLVMMMVKTCFSRKADLKCKNYSKLPFYLSFQVNKSFLFWNLKHMEIFVFDHMILNYLLEDFFCENYGNIPSNHMKRFY